MRQEIEKRRGEEKLPRLLLHACCAPCSSACLERLLPYFAITVFYYNPNIDEEEEYRKRAAEEQRLIGELNRLVRARDFDGMHFDDGVRPEECAFREIAFIEGDYRPGDFLQTVRGLEKEPEGGARCTACFRLRLRETAAVAAKLQVDYFTTTLTISPLKDADRLNAIGRQAGAEAGVCFLASDFKKREGFKRSIELSERFGLYRQDYCGCGFSRRERESADNQ